MRPLTPHLTVSLNQGTTLLAQVQEFRNSVISAQVKHLTQSCEGGHTVNIIVNNSGPVVVASLDVSPIFA